MNNPTTRRNLLIAASMGGVAAAAGMASRAEEHPSFGLEEKRRVQTALLRDAFPLTESLHAPSRDGMMAVVDDLYANGVLSGHDYETLAALVSRLFDDKKPDELRSDLEHIVAEAAPDLGETADSIAAAVPSSVEVDSDDWTAIADVFEGALYGAATAYAIFKHPVAAAAGAFGGGLLRLVKWWR